LQRAGIRVEVDVRDEKIGYKIREAQTQKIPFALVLGDKEIEANTVNVRRYGEKATVSLGFDAFLEEIQTEITNKVGKK